MKAIITVTGKDRIGILAEIAGFIGEVRCNVEDISQTIMQGNFVMIMMVSLANSEFTFEEIKQKIDERFGSGELTVHIQRTEIFERMYRV